MSGGLGRGCGSPRAAPGRRGGVDLPGARTRALGPRRRAAVRAEGHGGGRPAPTRWALRLGAGSARGGGAGPWAPEGDAPQVGREPGWLFPGTGSLLRDRSADTAARGGEAQSRPPNTQAFPEGGRLPPRVPPGTRPGRRPESQGGLWGSSCRVSGTGGHARAPREQPRKGGGTEEPSWGPGLPWPVTLHPGPGWGEGAPSSSGPCVDTPG